MRCSTTNVSWTVIFVCLFCFFSFFGLFIYLISHWSTNTSNLHDKKKRRNKNKTQKKKMLEWLLMPGSAATIYKDLCHNFTYNSFHFQSLALFSAFSRSTLFVCEFNLVLHCICCCILINCSAIASILFARFFEFIIV